ncbi:ADP-ribosylation_factor 1 [Hexamita inflata]|uniref:ADP-ribosylation factor 1 n=1 Tax=Hexamita inflata TaxID=28002 RepID=A0AA86NTT0_9EUKA|nr:ADP-ribosylation factor 1 [Hexamita inflata]
MSLRKLRINVLMFGLDNSGKSQLFNQWCNRKLIQTSPTKGFTIGTVQSEDASVAIRDFGGQPHLREFWRHYLQSASVVFFVIDSTQRDYKQIQDAKSELSSLLDNEMIDWDRSWFCSTNQIWKVRSRTKKYWTSSGWLSTSSKLWQNTPTKRKQ